MKLRAIHPSFARRAERGSAFVLVLWVSFGLVSLALYFANSMSLELRAADNRVAALEAEQSITGAARYASNLLATLPTPGQMPDTTAYKAEAVPVGNATFWFIGRGDSQESADTPVFGLVDEASKLNLNTATAAMLQLLPRMTPELAGAIIDWRDSNSDVSTNGGAESETYERLNPARQCKNTNFESVAELRLVQGATLEILFGEDANLNGLADPNEDDAELSAPSDNRDGRIDPGLFEYVTVYSRELNRRTNGQARINVSGQSAGNQQGGGGGGQNNGAQQRNQQVSALLQEKNFSSQRIGQITAALGQGTFTSVLHFYLISGMTPDEFAQISTDVTVSTNTFLDGLVNVNTASEAVLACIPGITNLAATLVSYRQSNPTRLNSIAWVADALGSENRRAAVRAGPYLTGNTYQFSADIAALGRHGRGFKRMKFIFDTSEGAPKILYRQDLTSLGWALGVQTRNNILATLNSYSNP